MKLIYNIYNHLKRKWVLILKATEYSRDVEKMLHVLYIMSWSRKMKQEAVFVQALFKYKCFIDQMVSSDGQIHTHHFTSQISLRNTLGIQRNTERFDPCEK